MMDNSWGRGWSNCGWTAFGSTAAYFIAWSFPEGYMGRAAIWCACWTVAAFSIAAALWESE